MPIGDYCEKPAATVDGGETVRVLAGEVTLHDGGGV